MKYVLYTIAFVIGFFLFVPLHGDAEIRHFPLLVLIVSLALLAALIRLGRYGVLMAKNQKLLRQRGMKPTKIRFLPWASWFHGRYSMMFQHEGKNVQIIFLCVKKNNQLYHFEKNDKLEIYRAIRAVTISPPDSRTKRYRYKFHPPLDIPKVGQQRIRWDESADIGMILFDRLPAAHLCVLLGLFMVGTGIQGFRKNLNPAASANLDPARLKQSWLMRIFLFCGGIIQGAFGSGGPFMVIYAAKALPDKTVFRVTLSLFWLMTNSCRLINWSIQNTIWNWENLRLLLILFPFMITGLLLGDMLHRKVSTYYFRLGVYTLLGISGIFMFAANIRLIF